MCAGFEIPAIDGAEFVAEFVKNVGGFLNLNELEFSDTNAEEMKKRGYVLVDDESNTVRGSAEIAKKAFAAGGCAAIDCAADGPSGAAGGGIGVESGVARMNFCSSRYKDAVQLRLRLLRTAQQYARPFDEITEDGTILFGRMKVPDGLLEQVVLFLQENELPDEAYAVSVGKNTIETAAGVAEELAAIFEEEEKDGGGFEKIQVWIIEQYPFEGGFVVGSERIY